MKYNSIVITKDTRKPKDVIFSNFYNTGLEKDVLLQFLDKFNGSYEIDTNDLSKLISISAPNVKFKIKGNGLNHYFSYTDNSKKYRRIDRASIAQIKEIVNDKPINRESREEILNFLEDRINPSSPNYGIPFNFNDKCTWDNYEFGKQFSEFTIRDLFKIGLSRGIIKVFSKEKYLNNLLRSHNLPYRLDYITRCNKPMFMVRKIEPEPMIIKIYR